MSDEWVMVPRDLLQRVDAALQRHLDRHAPMRIPVDQTDSDLVQSDVQALISAPAAPLDRSAPARPEDMTAFAAELKADPAKAQSFFQSAGLIDERGELMPEYAAPQQAEPVAWRDHVEQRLHNWRQRTMNRSGDRLALDDMMSKESIDDLIDYVCDEWSDPVAPQQAEPVAQIGWSDEFGNLFPMAAWKPAQRTHHDAHKTAWRPVFLHPPAAEVQRLRDAAKDVCEWADAAQWALGNETGVPAAKLDALRRALEGGE